MKLYLQSYAGGHKSKDIYEQKIKPLFNAANMKIDETGMYCSNYSEPLLYPHS